MMALVPELALAAGTFTVNVHIAPDAPEENVAPCDASAGGSCALSLGRAIALIGSGDWQRALPVEVDSVRLQLVGDTYRIEQPMLLRWGETVGRDVTLEIAGESGRTRITGAAVVKDWLPVNPRTAPARLRAHEQALVADISALSIPFNQIPRARGYGVAPQPVLTEVFFGDVPQAVASWPNSGFGEITLAAERQQDEQRFFAVKSRQVADWQDEPDLMAHAFWKHDWAAQAYLVALKDTKQNRMQLMGRGSPYGIAAGQRLRIENALAELDAPGEWYVDRASGMLYIIPSAKGRPGTVEVSVSPALFVIENSRNVVVSGIQFEKTRGDAIRVHGGQNVVLDQVVIRGTGNRALVINDSPGTGIRRSIIEDTGQGAVHMTGGDRPTLTPSRNFVEGCVIRRFSRLVKTMGFAVEVHGVGHRIAANSISEAPHSAILFSGNDHVIEGNTIFNVVKETSDAGAIYVGRDFTAHGNVIRDNLLRDIQPSPPSREVKGVYIDDQASGITVRNNIFARVQQPVFIGGGRDNVVEGNLFFRSSPVIRVDARGLEAQRAQTVDPAGTLLQKLEAVPYKSALFTSRFPNLPRIRNDDYGAPKYNTFRNNMVIESQGPVIAEKAGNGITLEGNKVLNETAFMVQKAAVDRKVRDDFRMRGIQ